MLVVSGGADAKIRKRTGKTKKDGVVRRGGSGVDVGRGRLRRPRRKGKAHVGQRYFFLLYPTPVGRTLQSPRKGGAAWPTFVLPTRPVHGDRSNSKSCVAR